MECLHSVCSCPVEEPQGFCSELCSNAADDSSTCRCPHPDCAGHDATPSEKPGGVAS